MRCPVVRDVLVVEDDEMVAGSIARYLRREGVGVRIASTIRISLESLRPDLAAIIVNLWLPDGLGFEVIERAMDQNDEIAALMLTGSTDPEHINTAQRLGAEYVCKPVLIDNIRSFVQRRVSRATGTVGAVDRVVGRFAERHRLTPAEQRIMLAAIQSTAREHICRVVGTSVNTIKTQIRRILDRTGADSLEELTVQLRGDALRRM